MPAGVRVDVGRSGGVWAYMVKGGQKWANLDRSD